MTEGGYKTPLLPEGTGRPSAPAADGDLRSRQFAAR